MTAIGSLDAPIAGAVVHGFVPILGWALAADGAIAPVDLRIDGEPLTVEIERVVRTDVAAVLGCSDEVSAGFCAVFNSLCYGNGRHHLECVAGASESRAVVGSCELEIRNSEVDRFYRRVRTTSPPDAGRGKLRRLLEILSCPGCGQCPLQDHSPVCLACPRCGARYPLHGSVPIMVRGEAEHPLEEGDPAAPASNHQYPDRVLRVMEETLSAGDLVLDVGAGRRSFGADGLVQLEIRRYPFTDIVNQGERLPFADAAFGLVVSLAVTEHVRRPWVLAAEIRRITRPGGQIVVDSAFLQPMHGYPSHYYNMTAAGLAALFDDMETLSLEPAPYQHPWFAVRWILDRLLAGLDTATRSALGTLTVDELLSAAKRHCEGAAGPLRRLPLAEHCLDELAAGFTLHCRKPP